MNEIWINVLESVYPVGSVYISTINTSPYLLFGFGEWQQIKDVFLLCAGDTYAGGESGGEATHALTVEEMPRHRHNAYMGYGTTDSGNDCLEYGRFSKNRNWGAWLMGEDGGDQPHNNMPPYLTVYAWQRIS